MIWKTSSTYLDDHIIAQHQHIRVQATRPHQTYLRRRLLLLLVVQKVLGLVNNRLLFAVGLVVGVASATALLNVNSFVDNGRSHCRLTPV